MATTLKPTVNYLSKEELSYQITIRGGTQGTVEEMRKALTLYIHEEKKDPTVVTTYPASPFTDEEDAEACTFVLKEVSQLLERFQPKNVKRIETKL